MKDLEKHKMTVLKDKSKNRKVFWFERFLWFITSENFLVIGGKDAHQNELLVKKYMDKGDLFLHCELHGAAVCILKNPKTEIQQETNQNKTFNMKTTKNNKNNTNTQKNIK